MQRRAGIAAIVLMASSHCSAIAGVSVTASYEYASISGYRTYNAMGFTSGSETTSQNVPRISVHGKLHEFIELGTSYAYISDLRGSGVVPTGSRIFLPPGQLTIIFPHRVEEDTHDLTFFAGGSLDLHPKVSLSAGPELHYFKSRTVFTDDDWWVHKRDAHDPLDHLSSNGIARLRVGE